MSFIPKRNGRRNQNWEIELKERFDDFLNNGNYLYDFGDENEQPKKQDIEARYLSQYFFKTLIKCIDNTYKVEITDDNYMVLKKDCNKTIFHFDVMNNPKVSHTFGKMIKVKDKDEWENWKDKLYHTVGNFTPIPWPIMKCKDEQIGVINMQDIHKGLDERWDLFLKLCQSTWKIFNDYDIHIDFHYYIKLTCQEIYFTEIFNLFKSEFGECDIEEICEERLLKWYGTINDKNFNEAEIITFGNDLNTDVKNINRLIKIRGKLMLALIKRNYPKCKVIQNRHM